MVINNNLAYIKENKDRILKHKLNILYNQVNKDNIKITNTLANYLIFLKLLNRRIIKLNNNVVRKKKKRLQQVSNISKKIKTI